MNNRSDNEKPLALAGKGIRDSRHVGGQAIPWEAKGWFAASSSPSFVSPRVHWWS
jgi:hypothetical protein